MYEKRIIAYIDVLGFENEINKTFSNSKEKEPETIRIYDFISLLHKDFEKAGLFIDSTYKVTQFSDSIVISYSKDEKASVFRILMSLLYLQMDAINYGLLLRGAVTCGPLVHDKTHFFGPAMNEAHEIEDTISLFPRILIDEEVINLAMKNPYDTNTPEYEKQCLEELLKIDFDGFYYIDYFNQGCEEIITEHGYEVLPDYFNSIYKIITNNEKNKNLRIIQKTNWLKGKYNFTLKKYKTFGMEKEEYKKIAMNLGEVKEFEMKLSSFQKDNV